MGEHLLCKQGVVGSNPIVSTRASLWGFGWLDGGSPRCRGKGLGSAVAYGRAVVLASLEGDV